VRLAGANHANFQSFGMRKFTALKQYRSAQIVQSNLSVVESPPVSETWFFFAEFQLGLWGNSGAMMVEQGRQQVIVKHCYGTAIADSGSIEATMQTHPSEMSACQGNLCSKSLH
jgi:hypothetical protein